MKTQTKEIPETIFYFEDWNGGLGKKYIVQRGPCLPVKDKEGNVVTCNDGRIRYENAPEKLIEVAR